MSEKCPLCGNTDRPVFGAIFIRALSIANTGNQTVGEKNDLFITLEQLQRIMLAIKEEEMTQHGEGR